MCKKTNSSKWDSNSFDVTRESTKLRLSQTFVRVNVEIYGRNKTVLEQIQALVRSVVIGRQLLCSYEGSCEAAP